MTRTAEHVVHVAVGWTHRSDKTRPHGWRGRVRCVP